MTVRQACLSACGLPGLLLVAIAVTPAQAQEVPQQLRQDVPPDAWQVDLLEPAPNSMHTLDARIVIRAVAREAFFFPDYLTFQLQNKGSGNSWKDVSIMLAGLTAEYQTGGQYAATLDMGTLSKLPPTAWRLKAISRKDGEARAETPWRYFTLYDPETAPDLFITSFEPTPQMVGGQKRWYFVWTVRNQGNAIAPPSKLHVICQTETGGNCLSGIAGTYHIPQLWPNRAPNDPGGAHKVWNNPPVALPPGAKLRFKATIDTGMNPDIPTNNSTAREFVADATPLVAPEQLRRAAALEKQDMSGSGTPDDPYVIDLQEHEPETRTLPAPETQTLPPYEPKTQILLVACTNLDAVIPVLNPPSENAVYGESFRVTPASDPATFRIPVEVTIPCYAEAIVLDLRRYQIRGGQTELVQEQRVVIRDENILNLSDASRTAYVAKTSFQLPAARYVLYASAHIGDWRSNLGVVNFSAVDPLKMRETLSTQAAGTAPVFGARTPAHATTPKSLPMPTTPTIKAPATMTKPHRAGVGATTAAPALKNQMVLAKPVITYPKANAVFTAPAEITVRANVVAGRSVSYGLREPVRNRVVAKNTTGQFRKLAAGAYCTFVHYEPGGPESACVPFKVQLATDQTPSTVPVPKAHPGKIKRAPAGR